MKKVSLILGMTIFSLSALASSEGVISIASLAAQPSTKTAFKKLAGKMALPVWVTQGGVNSKNEKVVIKGKTYIVLNACKPHDCSSESMALLYNPDTKTMAGVLSSENEEDHTQTLRWLNIPDELEIDGKTVLYASLSGSLSNHPSLFNYP
ncbi:Ivy family c-type lysozyme inhibitor [Pantoea anthophila]|uniref:Ivy family c-type lysozyme inhibitor n=1 Tax=Pantoea anthophila TaxID=470931 RepID=UPI002DBEA165|nr:Ivy family c-type lysozyme inhibitor [Pantoea anthophila]MEB7538546.1 Ivy family c-type lysozyme inhibitor [Pantoea anthophila]